LTGMYIVYSASNHRHKSVDLYAELTVIISGVNPKQPPPLIIAITADQLSWHYGNLLHGCYQFTVYFQPLSRWC